jgi:hypothetical protein
MKRDLFVSLPHDEVSFLLVGTRSTASQTFPGKIGRGGTRPYRVNEK